MESRTKTPHEMLLINGLAKVANDPIVQGAGPDVVNWAGRHEDAGGKPLDRLLGAPMEVDASCALCLELANLEC
jgi:hypothetical protein